MFVSKVVVCFFNDLLSYIYTSPISKCYLQNIGLLTVAVHKQMPLCHFRSISHNHKPHSSVVLLHNNTSTFPIVPSQYAVKPPAGRTPSANDRLSDLTLDYNFAPCSRIIFVIVCHLRLTSELNTGFSEAKNLVPLVNGYYHVKSNEGTTISSEVRVGTVV